MVSDKVKNWVRYLVTSVIVILALLAGTAIWRHYEVEPWTRDARVRADVIQIAPDVTGLVTKVLIKDNQSVRAGDVLFEVDKARYQLAYDHAKAQIKQAQASLTHAQSEYQRNRSIGDLLAKEVIDTSWNSVEQSRANLQIAQVQLRTAELNLQRSNVLAPRDGQIINLELKEGGYVNAGHPSLALIDKNSFYVEAYFEETKLSRVNVGDQVSVRLMGQSSVLKGYVTSIALGIADRDRTTAPNLLPSITPNFNWVRLAQRIPVRVKLVDVPASTRLIAGQTATVNITN